MCNLYFENENPQGRLNDVTATMGPVLLAASLAGYQSCLLTGGGLSQHCVLMICRSAGHVCTCKLA